MCLIQAVRLPEWHAKLVCAWGTELSLQELSTELGLRISEAVVGLDEQGCAVVMLENPNEEPVRLQKGQVLG